MRSKTIAEQAAWDLVRERGEEDRLSVVNPGAIIGPVLNDDLSYSLQAVQRLLGGTPGVPRLGFTLVDVRDVADLELRAMTAPEAGGERFIAATEFFWMAEIGAVLRKRLGETAAKVPTRTVPNFVVRAMALFDPGIRSVVGGLGQRTELSSEKARTIPRLGAPSDGGHDRRNGRQPDPPRPRGHQAALAGSEAGATGLEPAASGVTGRRSNRLSYAPEQWLIVDAGPGSPRR